MPETNIDTTKLTLQRRKLENRLLRAESLKLEAEGRKLDAESRQINNAVDKEAVKRRHAAIIKVVGGIGTFIATLIFIILKSWLSNGG